MSRVSRVILKTSRVGLLGLGKVINVTKITDNLSRLILTLFLHNIVCEYTLE